MKLKFLNNEEFIYLDKKFQINEISEYYFSHMLKETSIHFNISKDCLIKIFNYYNIKKTKEQKCLSKSRSWYMKPKEIQEEEIEKRKKEIKKTWEKMPEIKKGVINNKRSQAWKNMPSNKLYAIKEKISSSKNNKSIEEKNLISYKYSKTWESKTKEEKDNINKNRSYSHKKIFLELKEEDKEYIKNNMRNIRDYYYSNMDEEQKKERNSHIKEKWNNKSEKEKEEYSNKISKIIKGKWSNKTEEQLKSISLKASNNFKNFWSSKSKEYKESIIDKRNITMKENNSFPSNKEEDSFYNLLLQIFPKEDIERQYSDSRYPFNCDFYIRSLDLFIELNFHFTHGFHPFNSNSKEDQIQLEEWKEKSLKSNFYENAIKTWTIRDVNKLNIASSNHLNYITVYSNKEIPCLIEKLKKMR